jgi:hypothetical protein
VSLICAELSTLICDIELFTDTTGAELAIETAGSDTTGAELATDIAGSGGTGVSSPELGTSSTSASRVIRTQAAGNF